MAPKYVLPCSSCGEKIPVESRQAGQSIACSCGQTLQIPTMQGMRKLEVLVDSSNGPRATSTLAGVALGIALLGCLILILGAGFTAWTYSQRPVLIDMDYLTPWQTWLVWQDLHEGVRMPEYVNSDYLLRKKNVRQYMILGYIVIAVGVVTLATGGFIALAGWKQKRLRSVQNLS